MPGAVSTPDDTSTAPAPVSRVASPKLASSSPPARSQGSAILFPARSRQSKESPLPPGIAPGTAGGFASKSSMSATPT